MEKKIKQLYKKLKEKYGKPKDQWCLWCKRPKTKQDREEVIIGAILTQNTNWKNVALAIANLKKARANSLKKILKLGAKKIAILVKPSGFYQIKAGYLLNLAEFILKKYGDINRMKETDFKKLRKELLNLKGIGPETADSILLYGLDKPIFVIDEYTRRLTRARKLGDNLSYESLRNLFENNLKKDYRLYQDFHALIVIEGKRNNFA